MSELITTPVMYVLRRGLPQKHVEAAVDALSITPVVGAVITDHEDAKTALQFAPMVFFAENDLLALQLARAWAEQTQRPMLVISPKPEYLEAVYFDGHTESISAEFQSALAN